MEYPAAKIDRRSIELANCRAMGIIENITQRAKDYTEDPFRNQRLNESECVVCHYTIRAGGAAITIRPCGICGETIRSVTTNINVLCMKCAEVNGLCKHCGADVELKNRRKARPYEAGKEKTK